MQNKFARSGILLAASTVALAANAAAVDVTNVVSGIGSQAAPIALVGGAVLLIFVAVKAFKWVRASLS